MADRNSTCRMFSFLIWSIHKGFCFSFVQKQEKNEDRFENISELRAHTEQDHRSKRFSVWFTVPQPLLQTLFMKKNPNLQQTNFVCDKS